MKYYKLINNNKVLGAISSYDFIYYSPIVDCFLRGNEQNGEYISFQNNLYRATWMNPIRVQQPYITVSTIEITEEEYAIFMAAMRNNEIIEEEEVEEEPVIVVEDPIQQDTIEFLRTSKLSKMSYACRKTIENGFDLELRNEVKHFSLDTQDQLNLITLNAMADTEDTIPYHADGEECIFYTAAEIKKIVAAANNFKIYQTTYYNALKAYINSLETIEDIAAVEYGMTIPEEYQTEVLKSL